MVKAQTVEINRKCGSCGEEIRCRYTQFLRSHELGWERECSCLFCGHSEALYDLGPPPEEIRDLIIQRHGTWGVRVGADARLPVVLKVLKQDLKFSNDELKAVINRIPGVILNGTNVEMEWIAYLLRRNHVECAVVADSAVSSVS